MWQSSSLVNALLKQCFAQSVTLCECLSTLASVLTVVHLGSPAFWCLTRVLHTGTCSTGSLRVHDVKQEFAETFHAIYQSGSMCCHSIQACIERFRQCHTMCQIHEQLSWATNIQLNFGSTASPLFLYCVRGGVAPLLVCVHWPPC